ncbi:C-type lectin domain family 4 member C [Amia ocellicauda]|uniref:C-type lectin domain family 4 member C n=1 Tax=Amia ocellicauda TaxID=2972642 RepID=UPI003463CE42
MEMDHIYTGLDFNMDKTHSTVHQGLSSSELQKDYRRTVGGPAGSWRCALLAVSALLCLSLAANLALALLYHNSSEKHQRPLTRVENEMHEVENMKSTVTYEEKTQKCPPPDCPDQKCPVKNCPVKKCPVQDLKQYLKKWVPFQNNYYHFSPDVMTWQESREKCMSLGGDLVIVNSKEEQDFLNRMAWSLTGSDQYWIGLTDAWIEGEWRWVDNTPLRTNLQFWTSYPDDWKASNPLGEDCIVIYPDKRLSSNSWCDVSCLYKQRGICELH